ncbi:helix-turn-helix domain-containing protein [Exiguobacterium acetylicum]|uniref:helix-turn-helix domain-containing protein n=1 Tax=Exiguobacterium acetylicum TaxID=41170 RepID=UPI001EE36485|nr:helix-turn-helix transcriptional regulator [Exiguobacterium acetylicum]UKS57109.1 helix-turn-helix domain-containing protein [Exiguobacterium acetylicum]
MLGERIKQIRKQKKMTQTDVATGIITKSMLSMVENGKATPSLPALQAIAQRLQVTVEELMLDPRDVQMRKLIETIRSRNTTYHSDEKVQEILRPYLVPETNSYWQGQVFHEYGDALRMSDPELGLTYFEKAEQVFQQLGRQDEQLLAQIAKVYFLFNLKRTKEAYELIEIMDVPREIPLAPKTYLKFQILRVLRSSMFDDHYAEAIALLREGVQYMREQDVYYHVISFQRFLGLFLYLEGEVEQSQREFDRLEQFFAFSETNAVGRIEVDLTKGLIAIFENDSNGMQMAWEKLVAVAIDDAKHYIGQLEIHLLVNGIELPNQTLQQSVDKIWEMQDAWLAASGFDQAMMLRTLVLAMQQGVGQERLEDVQRLKDELQSERLRDDLEQEIQALINIQ